ncbi:MAG: nitroreductase family protein [Desulfobacteraceae bacterium]|jgi:nitroreductase
MIHSKAENNRQSDYDIDSMFIDRWSPRAFSSEPLSQQQIDTLFEAARWAPSCFNEQPWFFVYAVTPEDRESFLSTLVKKNQLWANQAPLLIYILVRRNFEQGARENRHASFDAGAAWMSLALQARKMGLYAHAMAGFDQEKAYGILKVAPKDFHIMAAVAVGYRGDSAHLTEDMLKIETPNNRKPVTEISQAGFPCR